MTPVFLRDGLVQRNAPSAGPPAGKKVPWLPPDGRLGTRPPRTRPASASFGGGFFEKGAWGWGEEGARRGGPFGRDPGETPEYWGLPPAAFARSAGAAQTLPGAGAGAGAGG